MDPGSYIALSAALHHQLPSVVEQLLQTVERERMEKEDFAVLALDGRAPTNSALDLKYKDATGWRHYCWEEIERGEDRRQRARLALQRVEAKGWVAGEEGLMEEIRELLDPDDDDLDLERYTDYSEQDSDAEMEET